MARDDKGPNISELFRGIFEAHPELLGESNNNKVYELFEELHPELELDKNKKQICANKKTELRKKHGIIGKKTKGRRGKPKTVRAPRSTPAIHADVPLTGPSMDVLESIEGTLENALRQAEETDPKGLNHAIKYLRRARNLVSLRIHEVDGV